MCGIAVSFNRDSNVAALDVMAMRHRGPDAQGEWTSPNRHWWLGHARLAIVDLSPTGGQPMSDPVSGNVVVFNGEIYNHLELRKELTRRGVQWTGTSDTETLLQAYRCWGESMLPRLKGMFSFALYDASADKLFAARDRLGIKPLYYRKEQGELRMASETRLLRRPSDPLPAHEAVAAYLAWGACPDACLLAPGIQALPAGHSLSAYADGRLETRAWWPASTGFAGCDDDPVRGVRSRLETAVQEHLLADVPVASFLSGGIDSSIITALAAQAMDEPLMTFSVGFKNAQFDETHIASMVSRLYRTRHHRIELSDEAVMEMVREAVMKMDLPSVDAINTYIVAKAVAGQGIKVALSGLGADELFGGYPGFRDVPRLKRLAGLPAACRRLLRLIPRMGERLAELPGDDVVELACWRRRFMTRRMLAEAGLPDVPNAAIGPSPVLRDDFARISWAELTGYMRSMLLRDSDQMSMAVSIELRVPFLDHELVEYALSLPAASKQRYAWPKGLLIEACKDLIPRAVYDRPKMGFSLPMDTWMRGPLADFVNEGLAALREQGVLRPSFIDVMHARFKNSTLHWTRLWSLVVLGWNLRKQT